MNRLISNLIDIDHRFKENLNGLQDGSAEIIKLNKARKIRTLASALDFSKTKMLVDPRFKNGTVDWNGVQYLPHDFFNTTTALSQVGHIDCNTLFLLSGSLPQQGNIESLVNFINFALATPAPILMWDWDNHHHLFISMALSLASDLYFYSHTSNEYEITKFCDYSFHMPAASCQWSKDFLEQNLQLITRKDRSDETLGRFVHYGLFQTRNKVIEDLSAKIAGVGFVDSSLYFEMGDLERFGHWTGHKTHFIIPTLDDVSTRIFDALVSGGVLILPHRFISKKFFGSLEENDYELYDELDLQHPERLIMRANRKFDNGGVGGAIRRSVTALRCDIGDQRLLGIKRTFTETIHALKVKQEDKDWRPGFDYVAP